MALISLVKNTQVVKLVVKKGKLNGKHKKKKHLNQIYGAKINNIGKDPIPQITNKNQKNDLFVLQDQYDDYWQPKTE